MLPAHTYTHTILGIAEKLRATSRSCYGLIVSGILQRFSCMLLIDIFSLIFFDFEDIPVPGFEARSRHQSASKRQLRKCLRAHRGGAGRS